MNIKIAWKPLVGRLCFLQRQAGLYKHPDTTEKKAPIRATLESNTPVIIVEIDKAWVKVLSTKGTGWILAQAIEEWTKEEIKEFERALEGKRWK